MFREMNRKKQLLNDDECVKILCQGSSGVLAVAGDDDYPYAVPLSYVFNGGKIYFHCAKTGHKLDAIARNNKVSFCVIDKDSVVPEEFTTYFRSVIVFGKARVLDEREVLTAVEILSEKYSPGQERRTEVINSAMPRLAMVELTIDHMTGKQAIELVNHP